jgi:hypothetical protein
MPCEVAAAGVSIEIIGRTTINTVLGKETAFDEPSNLVNRVARQLGVNRDDFAHAVAAYMIHKRQNPLIPDK